MAVCFSQGSSVYLKKPWTLGFRRPLWHFLLRCSKVVFNLLITFRLCSDVEKRPNIQQEQRKVKESHCCSYTTSSSVTPPPHACLPWRSRGKTQLARRGITVSLWGKTTMRNNPVGGCLFLGQSENRARVFGSCRTFLEMFSFTVLQSSCCFDRLFLFCLRCGLNRTSGTNQL